VVAKAVILRGAQTERRDDAGPVRLLLGGETHRPTLFSMLSLLKKRQKSEY
jgi:hypothetical protein